MPTSGPADGSELAAPIAAETITYRSAARPAGGGEITATGNAASAGFVFFFHDLPTQDAAGGYGAVTPNRFAFRMRRPSGVAAQVATPFEVTYNCLSLRPGDTVEITDALGTYTVRVTDTAAPAPSPY